MATPKEMLALTANLSALADYLRKIAEQHQAEDRFEAGERPARTACDGR